jgi:oligopeptide transport system substrate-binding protein
MLRIAIIPLALFALLVGAMAWSGSARRQRAHFVFINRGDIFTLDLNNMSYMQDFRLTYGIREGLYSYEAKTLRPIPAGASGFDLSEDKRVWTFHLRPQCVWTNGDPVTAHDYVFSFRRMLEEPGEYTYLFFYLKNAKSYSDSLSAYYADPSKPKPNFKDVGVEAVDQFTLKLTLADPVPYLLELLAFPPFYPRNEKSMQPFKTILNPDTGQITYRASYTRPSDSTNQPPVVTNGPFYLDRWEFKQRLILVKSPSYWDKEHVLCQSIEMVVNDNPLSQFLQYEANKVDWLSDVPADLAPELLAKHRQDLKSSPAFGTSFLTFMIRPNLPPSILGGAKNPLADVRVRQALAMAIDKHFIVNNITRMGEMPARTYLPPDGTLPEFHFQPGPYDSSGTVYDDKQMRQMLTSGNGIEQGTGPGLPTDIARARKLLADAGYPNGQGFPRLPILFNTDSTVRPKLAQVLKNQWKQNLNLDMDLVAIEGQIYKQRVHTKEYAIAPAAWYGDYPDVSTFTDKYLSGSLNNDSDYQDKEYDDLCDRATREPDPVKRMNLLGKAENKLDAEVPIVPLYHFVNTGLMKSYVHGVDPNPRGTEIFKGLVIDPH